MISKSRSKKNKRPDCLPDLLYTARVRLPAALADDDVLRFSEILAEGGVPVSVLRENNHHKAAWILQCVYGAPPDAPALAARINAWLRAQGRPEIAVKDSDISVEETPHNINWRAESYRAFPAFSVGPFFIFGSHYGGTIPDGSIGLCIDAATAFGSGEHGTTKGCLLAMLDLKASGVCPWNVLDMGTGSGILGIAAWRLWKTPVLAVDNDPEAVRVAAHHAAVNHVPADAAEMTCTAGDGFAAAIVQQKKPFDLILANILAGPLMTMAAALASCCDDNGYVILSGLLNEQAEGVIAAYTAQGLTLKGRHSIGDWTTLVLQKAGT